MKNQNTTRITIRLPLHLAEFANHVAKERSTTRSSVIADLLEREEIARTEQLMAEGYRAMSEENRREAEQALNISAYVVLRDETGRTKCG